MRPKIQEITRGVVSRALMVVDIGLFVLAFGLAEILLSPDLSLAFFLARKVSLTSCVWFAIALFVWHSILSMCNLYESKRMSTKIAEAADVLRAMSLSTICLWGGSTLLAVMDRPSYFFVALWAIGTTLLVAVRMILRRILSGIRKRGRNLHHILVLGTNTRAIEFGTRIEMMPERGYRLLGFVDDDWSGMQEFNKSRFRLACSYQALPEFLRKNVVDEIAIYLPLRSFYERASEIAKLANHHGLLVRLDADVLNLRFPYQHAESAYSPRH